MSEKIREALPELLEKSRRESIEAPERITARITHWPFKGISGETFGRIPEKTSVETQRRIFLRNRRRTSKKNPWINFWRKYGGIPGSLSEWIPSHVLVMGRNRDRIPNGMVPSTSYKPDILNSIKPWKELLKESQKKIWGYPRRNS